METLLNERGTIPPIKEEKKCFSIAIAGNFFERTMLRMRVPHVWSRSVVKTGEDPNISTLIVSLTVDANSIILEFVMTGSILSLMANYGPHGMTTADMQVR
jgi:hypothetical protein